MTSGPTSSDATQRRRGTAKAALQAASAATLETVERFLAVHCVRSPGAEVRSATIYRGIVKLMALAPPVAAMIVFKAATHRGSAG